MSKRLKALSHLLGRQSNGSTDDEREAIRKIADRIKNEGATPKIMQLLDFVTGERGEEGLISDREKAVFAVSAARQDDE